MKQRRWLGPVLALLGAGMMALGAARGELEIIAAKAVRICLECIGIG